MIATRRKTVEATLHTVAEDRMTTVNDPQRVWILDYSLSIYQAEIDWIKWLEAQIGAA